MDCKFKESVDEIVFWNVRLTEQKITFLEFYWWNIFLVFFFFLNSPWGILLFCLAKHRALSLDYFVLTNKERTARVTSPGGFAARQFLVMSHTDDEFPFRQYNYHDQLVARPDNYHDYCPEL